jgi:hypothetical protein
MAQDMSVYRERAQAHQRVLDLKIKYLSPGHLAARWNRSRSSIMEIPYEQLPYMEYGGPVLHRRRYHPDDVLAYEERWRGAAKDVA